MTAGEKDVPLLDLEADTIHLWHGELRPEEGDEAFWSILDGSELARAEKITDTLLKRRYVETHGRLRTLLAFYLNEAPEKIRLDTTQYGKPYLADKPEMAFNLSHSGNKMVVAVRGCCNLGVDIEICQPRNNFPALVNKCFAEEETDYWSSLPESQKTVAFYRFWTGKEAFVKAVGRGISLGLKQCVINPDNPETLLRIPAECGLVSRWHLQHIALANDYCCAVATDKPLGVIQVMDF